MLVNRCHLFKSIILFLYSFHGNTYPIHAKLIDLRSPKPEKTANISQSHHWFPHEMTCEKRAQKFHTYDVSLPRSGIISMEFLHPFLRRHFAGKPVVASQNVSCLLKCLSTPILPQNDIRSVGFDCHGVALAATLFHCTWPQLSRSLLILEILCLLKNYVITLYLKVVPPYWWLNQVNTFFFLLTDTKVNQYFSHKFKDLSSSCMACLLKCFYMF